MSTNKYDSETRGWKWDGIYRLEKKIGSKRYYIGRSHYTMLYWVWICEPKTDVIAELPRLSDAKRAAHAHARENTNEI